MKTEIEMLELLERELQALQAHTYRARTPEDLREILGAICGSVPREQIRCEDRPFLRQLELGVPVHATGKTGTGSAEEVFSFQDIQTGITGADYALADTGTLVLFSGASGGRWLSLAPPRHVALVPEDRILPSLADFLALFPSGEALQPLGSAVTFISGASRTADIELNLVHGAHGPKELHVIVLLFPVGGSGK